MGRKPAIPQKGESPVWYFYRQLTRRPAPVKDVDLRGKTAIVTGSNTGLGFEVSRQLLELGLSRLILAVRSEEKGKAAAAKLTADLELLSKGDGHNVVIEVWPLDLSLYDSVVAFAQRAQSSLERLDHVILNAGVGETATRVFNAHTGHDETVQVNYLSTALLALLLLPVAEARLASGAQPQPARLTFVSSEVAGFTKFKEGRQEQVPILAALDSREDKVDSLDRMFVGKLLQQFFYHELALRVPPSVALVNACSPGSVYGTDFDRAKPHGAVMKFFWPYVGSSPSVGARMITDAAVNHGEETHGQFLSFQEVVGKASIIYEPEGKRISEQLWKEMLEEFAFANVEDILRDVTATK